MRSMSEARVVNALESFTDAFIICRVFIALAAVARSRMIYANDLRANHRAAIFSASREVPARDNGSPVTPGLAGHA